MNIRLLDALLQLFALLTKTGGSNRQDRGLVYKYLNQQFNDQIAKDYIAIYDDYVKLDLEFDLDEICRHFNEELEYEQKLLILIRLIEIIYTDKIISPDEYATIEKAAYSFNIGKGEFQSLFQFITTEKFNDLTIKNLLVIDSEHRGERHYHIQAKNLRGSVAVLLIASANLYVFRYRGQSNLNLNGQQILQGSVYAIKPGNVLKGTRVRPVYYSDIVEEFLHREAANKTVFEAREITFHFPNGVQALHAFDLVEESGRMVAIMGASGAGKSTLLSVLNGSNPPSAGTVKINGVDIYKTPKEVEGVIGFVAQEDLLIEELTVFQNLYLNARLCFGQLSKTQIHRMVEDLLEEIGLSEIQEQVVGNALNPKISGGQRKRLNIALELIREPSVLFVDEPTSGLSSRDSENVMDLLKELTLRGKLVFVVIHQPSAEAFKLFDRLVLLDKGGYPVFYGNPLDGIRYFRRCFEFVNSDYVDCNECGNVRPDQMFAILESKVIDVNGQTVNVRRVAPEVWYERFKQNFKPPPLLAQRFDKPYINFHLPSYFKQYRIFMTRDVLTKITKPAYLAITFLETPLLALILAILLKSVGASGVYTLNENDNIPTYFFISVLVALFVGMTQSAEEILRDRRALQREAYLHLSRQSYLLAKVSILFAIAAVQMLFYVAVGNWILEVNDMFWPFWLMLFSVSCFANMLGLNISATFNEAVSVYILVPLMLIPQILLSGAMVSFSKLHPSITAIDKVPLVGDMMASRWAYEGLAVYQYKENRYEKRFFDLNQKISAYKYKSTWIDELLKRNKSAASYLTQPENPEQTVAELRLLQNELQKERRTFTNLPQELINKLTISAYDSAVYWKIEKLLQRLNVEYAQRLTKASLNKEQEIKKLQAAGVKLEEEKKLFSNAQMAVWLTNYYSLDKILAHENELVQLADPVYWNPATDVFFLNYRTHFYAPYKPFLGLKIDTFWFNVLALWGMAALLYATLYFEVLPKLKSKFGVLVEIVSLKNKILRRVYLPPHIAELFSK